MFQCVKLTEHKTSLHAVSMLYHCFFEDVDISGCMFIEMGMNQRWSCFLHCLYPHSMFDSIVQQLLHVKTCSHIRCMHK